MAAVGVGDPVRLVEHQQVAAHRRLLDRAAHDRGVGVDLLLAGGEADGAGRQLGRQPGVGLVRELAQRRGVDPAAVLLQREEGVVGLAGVGRAEVEDDVLGARRADGELGLGAVHPALLGELLDAGGRAVVGAGLGIADDVALTASVRLLSIGVLRGNTHRGNMPLVGGSRGGSARARAVPAAADPTEGNSGNPPNMPGRRGVRRHATPPGPRRAAAPRRRGRGSPPPRRRCGAGRPAGRRRPVGHGHRAAHRVVLDGVCRPQRGADRQHPVGHGGPAAASSGGRRSAARGRRAGRPRCGPPVAGRRCRGHAVDGWTTTTRIPSAARRRAALHTCRDCRRRTEPAAVRAARARAPARVIE